MGKPRLSFWQIWNMSFGFLGIQFGWGLQMANMSAIYSYLGADPDSLAILWLAAPVTGVIIQPLIGQSSDRLWTRLGRRRPFILGAENKWTPPAQPRPEAIAGLADQRLDDHPGDGRGQPQDGQGIGIRAEVAVNGAHVGHLEAPAELDAKKAEAHVPDLPERKPGFIHKSPIQNGHPDGRHLMPDDTGSSSHIVRF